MEMHSSKKPIKKLIENIMEILVSFSEQSTGVGDIESAEKAREEVLEQVRDLEEVEGVGISPSGKGYKVKVNLSAPLPREDRKKVPKQVGKVSVTTEVTGSVAALCR